MTQVIDTENHGTVIMLDGTGAIGFNSDTIEVFKTGSYDEATGKVTLNLESEWAQLTPDEAALLARILQGLRRKND